MTSFGFITDKSLRRSVELDSAELDACISAHAWKAAHVLAGSIVEAVLLDTLLSVEFNKPDPLKMSLDQAIGACEREHILSSKTAGLTHVIREYRNLIHPGRAVRLKEQVTEQGAKIAAELVALISREVAEYREGRLGNTAEQIVAKLEKDPSATAFLRHLLKEMGAPEQGRLVLEVLPARYYELQQRDETDPEVSYKEELSALKQCFRLAYESGSDELRKRVGAECTSLLRNGTQETIKTYFNAFFVGADIQFVPDKDIGMVTDYLLASLRAAWPLDPQCFAGLGSFLSGPKLSMYVRGLLNRSVGKDDARTWEKTTASEFEQMDDPTQIKVREIIEKYIEFYKPKKSAKEYIDILERLKVAAGDIPF